EKLQLRQIFVMLFILSERLLVSGSDESVSAYDGEDVTLSCSVDSYIPIEDIEVSWIRTDGDILVLLFQNNETLSDASDEQYRDRVEFFTAEIPKGNFSLRLKSVRTEDKGVYMCLVFAGDLSANATVVLEQLVSGSDRSVSAYDGEDVTLSCSVDSHIKPEHIEKVLWRKTDGNILVLCVIFLFCCYIWSCASALLSDLLQIKKHWYV
uniref:Ig-like domain-containing protein n=1 Tax=Sinocyclocheilus grahami TaxID=75366 RepID=A0A672RML5_SINGR